MSAMKGVVIVKNLEPFEDVLPEELYLYSADNTLVKITKGSTHFGMGNKMCSFKKVNSTIIGFHTEQGYHMMSGALKRIFTADTATGDILPLHVDHYQIIASLPKLIGDEVAYEYDLVGDQVYCKLILPSDKLYTETGVLEHIKSIANFATHLGATKKDFTASDVDTLVTTYWRNNKNILT